MGAGAGRKGREAKRMAEIEGERPVGEKMPVPLGCRLVADLLGVHIRPWRGEKIGPSGQL